MKLNQFPSKDRFQDLAKEFNVIPVGVEILADMETPVSLINKFYKKKGPIFLFESVQGGEQWGRYSFMGASAHCHIRVFSKVVEIEKQGKKERIPHNNKPLSILRNLMSRYRAADIPGLPRFWGGMVGYFTFEMVSFFENIANKLPSDKAIASFIIPDEVLIFDNITNKLICLVPCFIEKDNQSSSLYDKALKRIDSIFQKMNQTKASLPLEPRTDHGTSTSLPDVLSPLMDSEKFRSLVTKIKKLITEGEIIQAVLSQPFVCSPPEDILSLYRAQRYINPSPYLFFLHIDSTALVGSSPETMVRLENDIAILRPIAGTRPRGITEQEDRDIADELLHDEKERAEHLMLVDLGRNDLGRVAKTGTVQVTDLMIVERYSHVMHLVSNISCDLKKGHDAWDLLEATFPAGTLSGAPKIRAMEIISDLEKEARGPYGGAVGYVSFNGNMDLAITIRTACIEDGSLTVRAGAGIVADSDPELERIETINKAKAIEKALQLIKTGKENLK